MDKVNLHRDEFVGTGSGPKSMIYLASQSPRRRELLKQIGVNHEVVAVEVDETRSTGETPEDYVVRLALTKARSGKAATLRHPTPVLAADTAVVVSGSILGKPSGKADALGMLRALSGRRHRVLTAVALVGEREDYRLSISRVTFRIIGEAEAEAYWKSREPADKAGGYAIQGQGAVFVSRLEGSYSGVMGLPLYETAELLEREGIDIFAPDTFDGD